MDVLTFSRRHVHRVSIEVTERRPTRVNFTQTSAHGTERRQGEIDALVMQVRGSPLDPPADADEEFELLGLRGDLELLLDPATRVPLQLRGHVKVLGRLSVELRQAVLR